MKKMLILLLVLILAAVVVTRLGKKGTSAASDPPVTLVFAEVNPPDSVPGQADAAFQEKAAELSGGSVTIDLRPSGELGSESTVLDTMLGGESAADLARVSALALTGYGAQKARLLSVPYLFESREHVLAFVKSDLAAEFLAEPQEIGLPLRGVFYGTEGFRHFFTTAPAENAADLAGRSLRVGDDAIVRAVVEQLGAVPVDLSFGRLYDSLSDGTADGAEQTVQGYASNLFPEVAPNLLLDGHTLSASQVLITEAAWERLTPAQQEVLMEAGRYAAEYHLRIAGEEEAERINRLRESGCTVTEVPDKTPWRDACHAVIAETVGDQTELYDAITRLKR